MPDSIPSQTAARTALRRVLDDPRLLSKYALGGIRHRILGPLTSRRRRGGLAIFHIGRCGSTVTTDLLAQHPDVYWDGETYIRVITHVKQLGKQRSEVEFDPVGYVGRRINRSGSRWFGFDLKFSHVSAFACPLDDYVDGLHAIGVDRLVVLRRENYLRVAVSALNGGRRGSFHNRGQQAAELPPLHINPDDVWIDMSGGALIEHFRRWDRAYAEMDEITNGRTVLHLTYEDDIEDDPTVAYRKVVEFLELRPHEVSVRLERSNPAPLERLVANLHEIADHLDGSPYASFVDG